MTTKVSSTVQMYFARAMQIYPPEWPTFWLWKLHLVGSLSKPGMMDPKVTILEIFGQSKTLILSQACIPYFTKFLL